MCSVLPGQEAPVYSTKEDAAKSFRVGCYLCPQTKAEVDLETDVPRAYVRWPVKVQCKSCGQEHSLEYDDVHQCSVFGRE